MGNQIFNRILDFKFIVLPVGVYPIVISSVIEVLGCFRQRLQTKLSPGIVGGLVSSVTQAGVLIK